VLLRGRVLSKYADFPWCGGSFLSGADVRRNTDNCVWRGVFLCGMFSAVGVEFPTEDLEGRIRKLCAMAVAARESEWVPILSELRSLIHNHVTHVREQAAVALVGRNDAA